MKETLIAIFGLGLLTFLEKPQLNPYKRLRSGSFFRQIAQQAVEQFAVTTALVFAYLFFVSHLPDLKNKHEVLPLLFPFVFLAMKLLNRPLSFAAMVFTMCFLVLRAQPEISLRLPIYIGVWNLALMAFQILFEGLRFRLLFANMPEAYRGLPALFLAAALLSLGFSALPFLVYTFDK